jgi:tetratricopeptide (TPR) repeat protein
LLTPHLENSSPNIALYMLVADLYLQQGLVKEAQAIYWQAQALALTPEAQAQLNMRLALTYHRLSQPLQAQIYWQAALEQFETLGDTATVQAIEAYIAP